MSVKTVAIPGIGSVNLYKRRGSTAIRVSFSHDGAVRVSMPYWVPYQAGIEFARKQADWIEKHRPAPKGVLKSGDRIGKAHRLVFLPGRGISRVTTSVKNEEVRVSYAITSSSNDSEVQKAAFSAAQRALKKEAESLLPDRLSRLAIENDFKYRSVTVKQLKSRWGSCNSHNEITLSYYLMQLPWQLIDYVLLHELTHTEQLHHGPKFWARFERAMPGAKQVRKLLKQYHPVVTPSA